MINKKIGVILLVLCILSIQPATAIQINSLNSSTNTYPQSTEVELKLNNTNINSTLNDTVNITTNNNTLINQTIDLNQTSPLNNMTNNTTPETVVNSTYSSVSIDKKDIIDNVVFTLNAVGSVCCAAAAACAAVASIATLFPDVTASKGVAIVSGIAAGCCAVVAGCCFVAAIFVKWWPW